MKLLLALVPLVLCAACATSPAAAPVASPSSPGVASTPAVAAAPGATTLSPAAYRSAIGDQAKEIAAALSTAGSINAGTTMPDAAGILANVNNQMTRVAGEAHALNPPACYAATNRDYVAAVDQLTAAVGDGLAAARKGDIAKVRQGASEMQAGNAKFAGVASELTAANC